MKSSAVLILMLSTVFGAAQAQGPADQNASEPVHLAEPTAAALVIKRAPVDYPVQALIEHTQGTVVLNVTISATGTVREVTVASGEPDFAEAAIDSIKKWKYQPYTVEGKPTQFATQVTFGFHDKSSTITPPTPPLPGRFRDGKYQNEFFGLSYPLSSEWIRLASSQSLVRAAPGEEVLLVESHAPVWPDGLNAPSGFVLTTAVPAPGHSDAREDLTALAATMSAEKKVAQDGETSQFDVAGLTFYRANLKLAGDQYQTLVCTMANGRLFRWNFAAVSQAAMKKAVATLNAIKRLETAPSNPDAKLAASDPGAPTGIAPMSLPPKVLAASIRKLSLIHI